jgi:Domain of unknown function (DUF397)
MSEHAWVKSSYSGSQANCVEVAVRDSVVVRDTKDRTGPVLRFTLAAWRDFAGQVKGAYTADRTDLLERCMYSVGERRRPEVWVWARAS